MRPEPQSLAVSFWMMVGCLAVVIPSAIYSGREEPFYGVQPAWVFFSQIGSATGVLFASLISVVCIPWRRVYGNYRVLIASVALCISNLLVSALGCFVAATFVEDVRNYIAILEAQDLTSTTTEKKAHGDPGGEKLPLVDIERSQ